MISSSLKNSMLTLALSALITGTDAAVTCYTTSPQYCWVIRIWELMKSTSTGLSPTSYTACCEMDGVDCYRSGTSTKVDVVNWQRNPSGFTGGIPSDIQYLPDLKKLIISYSKFTRPIPKELGKLTKLNYLNLDYNDLPGPIPKEIGNLKELLEIDLTHNRLSGSYPEEIGTLLKLENVWLGHNKLSGQIPQSIGDLPKLIWLGNRDNAGLSGTFKPRSGITVTIDGTGVILCGSTASKTPANFFPPLGTNLACLASGPATSLSKRTEVFSRNVEGFPITCNVDNNLNPYQDCLNSMSYFCDPDKLKRGQSYISDCKRIVDSLTNAMNSYWQNWHSKCDSPNWLYTPKYTSQATSTCSKAIESLKSYAKYYDQKNIMIPITDALVDSGNTLLWNNEYLQ